MILAASIDDIRAAAQRVAGIVRHTALIESPQINEMVGGRILFKPENLQYTGSFKFRGATNTIKALSGSEKSNGVIAFSSGNHAQGVAYAAKMANIPSTIIMPKDAPAIKIQNTKSYGADVILYDRYTENREEIGERIKQERGGYLIKPYDAVLTIAGQGTAGLEIVEDCQSNGITPNQLISPAGGGGLMAGLCLAMKNNFPDIDMFAAEPADFNDLERSLASGEYETNSNEARSICDAILTPTPGQLTFPINHQFLAASLTVTDEEVKEAIRVAFDRLKLVVEPGGVVGLAAALTGKLKCEGKTTVIVLSGGNIDADLFAEILGNS